MPRGILIPEDDNQAIQEIDAPELAGLQAGVGGYVEMISLLKLDATMIVDEEGKVRRRLLNRRATVLWWLAVPEMRGNDLIVGPALVTGFTDRNGDLTDLGRLTDLLLRTERFQVKIRPRPTARWEVSGAPLSDYFAAARTAVRLRGADGWPRTRVVAVDGD